MKYIQTIVILVLMFLTSSFLTGQNWREANLRTSEGFTVLKQQYETDYSLPIDERLEFLKTGVVAASYQKDSLWIRQFAYYAASSAGALDSLGTALEYISIARAVAEERDPFTVNIISYQGVIHKQAGDYEQALTYYEEALQLVEKNFPDKVVLPLGNIASLYRSQKNYEKAIGYIHRSKQLSLTLDSPKRENNLVYDYAELCLAHKHLGNLDSAAYYGHLSLQNLDQIDKELNMKATAFAYITVAELLTENLQQPDRAKPLLDSALLYTEGGYTTKVKVSLGKYYLAKKDYAAAAAVIQELQETEIQAQTTLLRVLELSLQYYTAMDEFEKALAISNNIDELKAVRFNKDKARLTTLFSAKFENKKKEEQLLALQYQQKVTRLKYQTRSLLLLLVILLLFGVTLYLKRQVSRKKKFADTLQREVEVKTKDLKIANAALTDKVEKLNTFNYTVSHDLKAPLTSAFNFLDLIQLQSRDLLSTNNRQLFDHLYGVLTQMKEMVNGISLYLMADRMDLQPEMVATEDIVNGILTHCGTPRWHHSYH